MTDQDDRATSRQGRREHQRAVRAELGRRREAGLRRRHQAKRDRLDRDLVPALRLLRQRTASYVRRAADHPDEASDVATAIGAEVTLLLVRGSTAYLDIHGSGQHCLIDGSESPNNPKEN